MALELLWMTPEEKAVCTALKALMRNWTSRGVGKAFALSEHTIRSLTCGRRRPGSVALKALEDGAVERLRRIGNGDQQAGSPDFWWEFLDTVLRCRLFPIGDPSKILRSELNRALEDGLVPEDTSDPAWETTDVFLRGAPPSRELLEVIRRAYSAEAAACLHEDVTDDGLRCREMALIAELLLY